MGITFAISLKKMRSYTCKKPQIGLWKHTKNHIHKVTHYGETALLKTENFVLFSTFYFKNKSSWHFNFLSVRYFGKGLFFLKIWHIIVNYCWSYGPSNLLFHVFPYCFGHLDNRQTKTAENWAIHFFWKLTPK